MQPKTLVLHNAILQKLSRNWKMKVLALFDSVLHDSRLRTDDFKLVTGKEYKNVTVDAGWSLTASC